MRTFPTILPALCDFTTHGIHVVVLLHFDGGFKFGSECPMRCTVFLNMFFYWVIHPCYEQRFKLDISESLISIDMSRQRIYATCECVNNNAFVALSLGRACLSHLGLNKGFCDAALK
eukprot:487985_1